jgi:putative tricarboxylic transport membrane protein
METQNPLTIPVNKDVVAGAIFFAFAIGFGVVSTAYPMGSAAQMGPGYYPLLLSGVLGLLGLVIAVVGWRKPAQQMVIVRPLALISVLAAPLLFAVTLRPLGFVAAVILTSLLATMAAPRMSWIARILTAIGLAVGCTAIFIWALGIPLPLLGSLLRF